MQLCSVMWRCIKLEPRTIARKYQQPATSNHTQTTAHNLRYSYLATRNLIRPSLLITSFPLQVKINNIEYLLRTCSLPKTMMQQCVLLLILVASTDAFIIGPGASLVQRRGLATTFTSTTSSLQMAGFGGAPKKIDTKLKPKQQWDRYLALTKTSERVCVAVRVVADASASASTSTSDADKIEWFQVGTVRSKDNAYTEAAVVRQRLLIAEHSRRLYPQKILLKDTLDWAYLNKDDQLVMVGKSLFGKVEMPADIEKMIGFVGLPDPSGFYMKSSDGLAANSVTKRVTKA
jgi:hypothetical protein